MLIDLASVQFFGSGLERPECVLSTVAGNLFVSDQRGGVTRIRPNGETMFIGGGDVVSNGIALLPDNSFVIANLAEDSDPDQLERFESALKEQALNRSILSEARGTKLTNTSSIAFGGPDRKTVFLGSLGGKSLATFRSPVAGVKPVHWAQKFDA